MSELTSIAAAGAEAAAISFPARVSGSLGSIGSFTGGRLETLGGLMRRYPITSTACVIGGVALVSYGLYKAKSLDDENRELRATLEGVRLSLSNLPNFDDLKEDVDGEEEGASDDNPIEGGVESTGGEPGREGVEVGKGEP